MTTKVVALQLALQALNSVAGKGQRCYAAISAINEALEQVPLHTRIAEEENAFLRKEIDGLRSCLQDDRKTYRVRVASLVADAARLDWLEANKQPAEIYVDGLPHACNHYGIFFVAINHTLRVAIDAEMGEKE